MDTKEITRFFQLVGHVGPTACNSKLRRFTCYFQTTRNAEIIDLSANDIALIMKMLSGEDNSHEAVQVRQEVEAFMDAYKHLRLY